MGKILGLHSVHIMYGLLLYEHLYVIQVALFCMNGLEA
jgi:hypothetical protein